MCDIFSFFEFKVRTYSFENKNKTDQLLSFKKIFLLYANNVIQLRSLTKDHM